MRRIMACSCVANNYDWLLPPVWRSPYVHYVCFTDNPTMNASGWEIRPLPTISGVSNGAAANRGFKLFPWRILPEHD